MNVYDRLSKLGHQLPFRTERITEHPKPADILAGLDLNLIFSAAHSVYYLLRSRIKTSQARVFDSAPQRRWAGIAVICHLFSF